MRLQQPNATIQEAHWKIHLLIEKLKKKGEGEKTNNQANVDNII